MPKSNVYEIVTDRIIAQLEQGQIPWRKPWNMPTVSYKGVKVKIDPQTVAFSRSTGKPYSLLNQLCLLKPGEYATFKQITEAGGKVKKGEKASPVFFFKMIESDDTDDKGNPVKKRIPVLRYYTVFHVADQCEDIEPKRVPMETIYKPIMDGDAPTQTWDSDEEADNLIAKYSERSGVAIHMDSFSDRAFYSPASDSITVPCKSQYKQGGEYYSTLFHESIHSTGHESRLNRFGQGNQHFGSENYSKEELVAEIGAASLCNMFGIETESTFKNSAAYIQSWLKALKNDTRMIVSAASRAAKAANYILGEPEEEEEEEE